MTTIVALVVLLAVLGACITGAVVSEWRTHRSRQHAAVLQRLRLQHEQFVAERRMQRIVGNGLTRLLQEARDDRD